MFINFSPKLVGTISHANYYPTVTAVKGTSLQRKSVAAIFGVKLFGGSVLPDSAAPVNASTVLQLHKPKDVASRDK